MALGCRLVGQHSGSGTSILASSLRLQLGSVVLLRDIVRMLDVLWNAHMFCGTQTCVGAWNMPFPCSPTVVISRQLLSYPRIIAFPKASWLR
jgi:hypothetical protein